MIDPASRTAVGRAAAHRPARRTDLRVLGQLTGRDRLLLDLLAEHQVLTTGQLSAVAFGSVARAQHRALTLFRLGVFDRFRLSVPAGSQPWHYTLGPVGAAVVAAARGVDPPSPAALRRRVLKLAASPRLGHLLGVNGFFIALHADARRDRDRALERWWSERRAAAEFDRLTHPDGYGLWSQAGRRVGFFLEYDTGSEARLVGKLAGYADLATAGGPTGPVLFTLPGPRREAGLHRLLGQHPPPVEVATTTTELLDVCGASPADALWLPAGSPGRRRLIDLADRHPPPGGRTR